MYIQIYLMSISKIIYYGTTNNNNIFNKISWVGFGKNKMYIDFITTSKIQRLFPRNIKIISNYRDALFLWD